MAVSYLNTIISYMMFRLGQGIWLWAVMVHLGRPISLNDVPYVQSY